MKKVIILSITILLFFAACQKESIEVSWQSVTIHTKHRLWAADFLNEQMGYVVGGKRYSASILLKTMDGGQNWEEQATPEGVNVIFDVQVLNDRIAFACAYGNHIISTKDGGATWQDFQHPRFEYSWQPLRAVHFVNDTLGFVAGGSAYQAGVIFKTIDGGQHWDYQWFEQELRDIVFTTTEVGFACGYGILLKTINGGEDWELLDVQGDYFTSLHFPSAEVGYMVGNQGMIWKTENGGDHWDVLRKVGSVFKPRKHFEKVHFLNNHKGYIVGAGLVWTTENGGNSWQQLEGIDFGRFNGIELMDDGKGIVVGDDGQMVMFEE